MGWRIWVDTGGTFTDALAVDPRGLLHRAKVLSHSALRASIARRVDGSTLLIRRRWDAAAGLVAGLRFRLLDTDHAPIPVSRFDPVEQRLELTEDLPGGAQAGRTFELLSAEEAPVLAARLLTGTPAGAPLPVEAMRLGTTLGTNALLEHRGARVAWFVTTGFADLLRIGTQQRPDLFALHVRKTEPLYEQVVEVPERLDAEGTVLRCLDTEAVRRNAARLADEGIRVAAVALLHAYRNRAHELEVGRILCENGFQHVSMSGELAGSIGVLPRAETAVIDAYLQPVIRDYLQRVGQSLGGGRLHVMTSSGGLMGATTYRPKDSLLSGPAGGVVGAARAGIEAGFDKLIAFDMGGTSTDVSRFDGDFDYVFEHRVADAHLVAPALAIETVASGGGSVCWFDGHRLRVGPHSGGANPGPACYGAGGPLTLTDVNLLLGRLDPSRFHIPIDPERARERCRELMAETTSVQGDTADVDALLEGLLQIADERMAEAIRRVSIRRGYDPVDYALLAFGGAGGQHACAVAGLLGMRTVVVPPDAGLLSAMGLSHAVLQRFAERQVLERLEHVEPHLATLLGELAAEASAAVRAEGVAVEQTTVRRRIARMRFVGQDATLDVDIRDGVPLARAFERRYRMVYGHRPAGRAVELESLRVVASSTAATALRAATAPRRSHAESQGTLRSRFDGAWVEVPRYDRDGLGAGARVRGPAIVLEDHGTTVIGPDWTMDVAPSGALALTRARDEPKAVATRRPESVRLELFTHRFRAIAQEMGERLRQTAVSTNVKQRLDFSCAVLNPKGELIVNAPHIPVHLGALGLCVRRLAEQLALQSGDVVVTNHPAYGGSHLPDVTVVTPVFQEQLEEKVQGKSALLGYVASRAHHAEIGGTRPGSMPPAATRLIEEGVVIPPTLLVRGGETCWEEIRRILTGAAHPSRCPQDNLADLRAAVAANHAGAEALRALAGAHGSDTVRRYMDALTDLAERRIRDALDRLPDGEYAAEEQLDDGSPLRVRIEVRGPRADIDFSGSCGIHPGNLNATPAIVHSAVIYVLRLMLGEPLPLNEGLMRAVTLRLPPGLLNPDFSNDPRQAPAVVGGNVETSQRLVDTLLKALRLAACSQGTMNNLLFGNDRFSYYETVCGGGGAGPGFAGASAVHSHMTNTRITDPEILEQRYPVRLERFAIRVGSGGAGRYPGGDGAVRELTFLEPVELSLLTQHRQVAPFGLAGGRPGRVGVQRLIRRSGEIETLGSISGCRADPGDRLVLETPGGGGYGPPE